MYSVGAIGKLNYSNWGVNLISVKLIESHFLKKEAGLMSLDLNPFLQMFCINVLMALMSIALVLRDWVKSMVAYSP